MYVSQSALEERGKSIDLSFGTRQRISNKSRLGLPEDLEHGDRDHDHGIIQDKRLNIHRWFDAGVQPIPVENSEIKKEQIVQRQRGRNQDQATLSFTVDIGNPDSTVPDETMTIAAITDSPTLDATVDVTTTFVPSSGKLSFPSSCNKRPVD